MYYDETTDFSEETEKTEENEENACTLSVYGEYFYGNKISEYGLKYGYVDYGTLAKAFDAVLNNDIMSNTDAAGLGYWDPVSGYDENEDGDYPEVFQWYIVSDNGAEILQRAGEIVFYNEALDMYIWGVTHYGTAWSHVLTNIPCKTGKI